MLTRMWSQPGGSQGRTGRSGAWVPEGVQRIENLRENHQTEKKDVTDET